MTGRINGVNIKSMLEKIKNVFKSKKLSEINNEKEINYSNIGKSGTTIYSGYIDEEYLRTLKGTQRADIYDRMRRSHHQVKMCLSSVKNPIRGATWEIEAGDDSLLAQKDKEFIEFILFKDLKPTWNKFISEALSMCEFGHSFFEIVHKIGTDKKFGKYIGINTLGFRSQRTIETMDVDKQTGLLKSIKQISNGDIDVYANIPARFLLNFSIDQEGSNYEGISLLRACYGAWLRQETYLKLNAIGIEKFAVPTIMAMIPQEQLNDEKTEQFINVIQKYVTHQSNYLTLPKDWDVRVNNNTYDPQKVETSIDNEDKRISKAFLANFLELGISNTGSYALSNDLSDFFLSGIEYIANEIESPINQKLIPELIKMNFGFREVYPKLTHSGVSDKAGIEFSNMLTNLVNAGVLTADDKLEDSLRKRMKLTPKDTSSIRTKPNGSMVFNENRILKKIKLAEQNKIRLFDEKET